MTTNIKHDDDEVGDDHRPVEALDGIDQQLAHARPGEDGLGDDREGDQVAELEAEHGDDRDQDVLQQVHADDAAVAKALGAGELDVVLLQRLARAGARQPDHQRDLEQRQVERRQQDVAQAVEREEARGDAEIGGRVAAPGRRQPAQHHRKHHDQHQPDPERRQAEADDRAGHDRSSTPGSPASSRHRARAECRRRWPSPGPRAPAPASPACAARSRVSAGSPKMKERPRSPCSAPLRKKRYCSQIGRSRPSARTAASMSFWSICGLTSSQIGSPTMLTPKKTITDMRATSIAVCISRRRM